MPWKEVSTMSARKEFVLLASQEHANVRALCRQFGISPKTGYKLLNRYKNQGDEGLADRSRRPKSSPNKASPQAENLILGLRKQHPAWGAHKLLARLEALGHRDLPCPSTVTAILKRHGLVDPEKAAQHQPWQRFEHPAPNDLWQMDFKGHVALREGRCHPLTVLDDHSRYAVCLKACANEQGETVKAALTEAFRRYGLPWRMTMDNGAPWGDDGHNPYTAFTVWLLHLGIHISHSRPYHPQTQGKDERFHRTLKGELLAHETFADLDVAQRRFDGWRDLYNLERPHQALGQKPPVSRYRASTRAFPENLPAIDYAPDDAVRKVQGKGEIYYQGRAWKVGKAFQGYPVALRTTAEDGQMAVYFCQHRVATVDLREPQ